MLKSTEAVPLSISLPYIKGAETTHVEMPFSIYIDGNSFRASPEGSPEQCRKLGLAQSLAFDMIDHTIVVAKHTKEQTLEVIKTIVQELMNRDIIY